MTGPPRRRDRLLVAALLLVGVGSIVAGLALVHPAAGLVAFGVATLGAVTFDPAGAGKLRWPRPRSGEQGETSFGWPRAFARRPKR
jgi:hypothetical protein